MQVKKVDGLKVVQSTPQLSASISCVGPSSSAVAAYPLEFTKPREVVFNRGSKNENPKVVGMNLQISLLVTSASLLVTRALLLVARSY